MKTLALYLFIFSCVCFAQAPEAKLSGRLLGRISDMTQTDEIKVWVFFTDKSDRDKLLLAKPEQVVSPRSLERRKKVMPEDALIDISDIPVSQDYVSAVTSLGVRLHQRSKWFNAISVYTSKDGIAAIASLPFVKKVDIVRSYRNDYTSEESYQENNPSESPEFSPYSLDYGTSYNQQIIINTPPLHDLGLTGEGVIICMMDTEFTLITHEAFAQTDILATYSFVNNSPDVTQGYSTHGTKTFSTLGGFKETQIIGTAYGATFLLAHTEDVNSETPAEEDNWIAAAEWADSIGADITSTSLGYIDMDAPYAGYTWEDMDGNTALITIGADLAVGKGMVVFNSAGNSGYDPNHNTLGAPSDGDSVLCIGSVDGSGVRASSSSVGNTVDGRTKPDFMAMGLGVYVADPSGASSYSWSSGTSFSCPIAAGVAALLLQANPNLTPMEIRELLRATSSNSADPNREFGWGIIDALAAYNAMNTGIQENPVIPVSVSLTGFPNPFNAETTVQYSLPENGFVQVLLYSSLGETIAVLSNKEETAGVHSLHFNAEDFGLASGLYFVTLRLANDNSPQSAVFKLVYLK